MVLETLLEDGGGEEITEGGHLVGVRRPDGGEITLEMGCAVEYSTRAGGHGSVVEAIEHAERELPRVARAAARVGVAVLPGAMLPFTPMSEVPWLPKPRVQIMRDFFRGLGDAGSLADGVMGLTLSTQTSLDHTSEADLREKLRMQAAVSPVLSALFVNSPVENGRPTGALSRRMQFWRKIDPARCGVLPFALNDGLLADEVVEWALDLPVIYRKTAEGYRPGDSGRSFRRILESGFADGRMPSDEDWLLHLSQTWPQVRVRKTLELRAWDGLTWPDFGAAPALWTGLTYDKDARNAAWELLSGFTLADMERATDDVAVSGLRATVADTPVTELAATLLKLAEQGLAARVRSGLEKEKVLSYLGPLWEILDSGITPAERLLARWDDELRHPDAYVRAYQI
ncbi:glutamate-cysteine ligase family protein [Streptomyces sp. NPDC046805]|uniref:glutamate-cysteine ligase family protein n=1 Tax=Streptomyces sp. NPDC046805 TaxID=3155134 RepID=UPI0033D9C083